MSDFWKALTRAPWETKPHKVFAKREGQPFLQGSARNMGHALLGDDNAYDFERKYLSDSPQGNRYASSDKPVGGPGVVAPGSGAGGQGMGFAALTGGPSPAPGGDGNAQASGESTEEIMRRMAQLMAQSQGAGFMTAPQVM